MSTRNDGGPAFGVADVRDSDGVGIAQGHPGMSLRDYFAAHAPAREIADTIPDNIGWCAKYIGVEMAEYNTPEHYMRVLVKRRCDWADALIAELNKP